MGQITLIEWKYATTITVKLIYAPNGDMKFFLLQRDAFLQDTKQVYTFPKIHSDHGI